MSYILLATDQVTHKLCSFSLSSRTFLSRRELVFSLGEEQIGGGRLGNELIFLTCTCLCFSDDPYPKMMCVGKSRVIFLLFVAAVIHSQEAVQGCLATRLFDL